MMNAPVGRVLKDLRYFDFVEYLARSKQDRKDAAAARKPAPKRTATATSDQMTTVKESELAALKRKVAMYESGKLQAPAQKKAKRSNSAQRTPSTSSSSAYSTYGEYKSRTKPAEALGRAPDSHLPSPPARPSASKPPKKGIDPKTLQAAIDIVMSSASRGGHSQRGSRGRGRGRGGSKPDRGKPAYPR
jgi:hypothetical protein